MRVTFWGVRGSLPCPGPQYLKYGGNTSCVEVSVGGETIILDAGTGLRACGLNLLRSGVSSGHIFLSHLHHDHIMGFPFFGPAYDPKFHLSVYASQRPRQTLRGAIEAYMSEPFFPVSLSEVMPSVTFSDLSPTETIRLGQATVRLFALNHPGGATGYRISYEGKSVSYITDVEHQEGRLDSNLVDFIDGSSVFIYDSTYSDEQYPNYVGWGHSTWQQAHRLGEAASVGKTVIFHHDPSHDDDFMEGLEREACTLSDRLMVAKENLILEL